MSCQHLKTGISAEPIHYAEEDVFVLRVSAKCLTCGARFQFRGLSDDPSPNAPFVSCDGYIAALPMIEIRRRVLS
jgi:hypothetical protein